MMILGGRSFGNRVPLQGLCLGSAAGLHCSAELPHLRLTPIQEFLSAGKDELPNAQNSRSKLIACHPNVKQQLSFRS